MGVWIHMFCKLHNYKMYFETRGTATKTQNWKKF